MHETITICTVGTGTAGNHSDVRQGLVNGIRLSSPDVCLLVPSASESSRTSAEIVAEELTQHAICHAEQAGPLSSHDSLHQCRHEMRAIIRRAKRDHPDACYVLNPTSGTKQMTTGAVLAGIDEGIERIEYITGERTDGVVTTGKERITAIDGRRILAEQSARNACLLTRTGAFAAAVTVLESCGERFPNALAAARMLAAWNRFDYAGACQHAAAAKLPRIDQIRHTLDVLREAETFALIRGADLLSFCNRAFANGHTEETLASTYRAAEFFAKLRLDELGESPDKLDPDSVAANPTLNCPKTLIRELRNRQTGGAIQIGLKLACRLLENTRFPLVHDLYRNKGVWKTLELRHNTRYGHGTGFAPPADVETALNAVTTAAQKQWPQLPELIQKTQFPDLTQPILNEVDHEHNPEK